jgi:hypothetical protein
MACKSIGALTAAVGACVLFISPAGHAQEASQCDRACLRQALDTYLAAVFKHDVAAAKLSGDHYSTLNTAVVKNGEGFWKDVEGYGSLQRRYFDPANGAAAFLGLLKQKGKDVVSSVRVKIEGGKVTQAEWFMQPEVDPQRLIGYPPPEGSLPTSERSSRFYLVAMANNYFQSGVNHDASWLPTDLRCKDPEPNPMRSALRHADLCHDNFGIYKNITKDLAFRRFPLVDEEAGVVLGAAIWVRFPGVTRKDNMVNEYFQVRNGTFTYIWTANYEFPKGTPITSGWENHQGDITR